MGATVAAAGAAGSAAGGGQLARSLGPVPLAALGVATIVGSGIFVLAGEAASEYAGPAVALSFVLAGIAAALAALCYAELAAAIPVTGSTYTFVGVALGPAAGWIVGWSILLEYLFGGAAIATGWSAYFTGELQSIGIDLLAALTAGPFDSGASGIVNLPAVLLIGGLALLLTRGVEESARATTWLTAVKLAALAVFVLVGIFYLSGANYSPFVPDGRGFGEFGWTGVLRAAGVVFFAYIGFDVVCNAAQEARDPHRTIPVGLLGALLVATGAYVAVAVVLVGLAPYGLLGTADPLSTALDHVGGLGWVAQLVDAAAVLGLAAGVLAVLYGQSRIFMRMGEDGSIPKRMARVSAGARVPRTATLVGAAGMIVVAGLVPLSTLADLISAGTLLAFLVVAICVPVLRRRHPELERPFRVPGGLTIPALAVVLTLAVALMLPAAALIRLVVWIAVGLAVYFAYSRTRMRDPRAVLSPPPASD